MITEDLRIPLSTEHKQTVLEALSSAIRIEAQEIQTEFKLETFNSKHFLKWDLANRNVIRNISNDRFTCVKYKRGPWELIFLHDTETNYLYSLMRQKRFFQLQDRSKYDQLHYIDALAALNNGTKPIKGFQQLTLFEAENEVWTDKAKALLSDMLGELQGIIRQFVLITFTADKDTVSSAFAYIPTPELQIAHEENWSEHIPFDYTAAVFTSNIINEDEDEEVELALREEYQVQRNEVTIHLIEGKNKKPEDS